MTKEINSIDEAMSVLATQKEGIPFEAIRYLRNHPPSEKIKDEIIFSLEHAYDDTYYDEEKDFFYPTPLWYAIVAENYTSKELIDPVINVLTMTEEDWDFLNEQGEYLIGKLAAKYPELVVDKVVRIVDRLVKEKSQIPYLFLFDAFYHADVEKYKDWFLKILKDDGLYWRDAFVHHLADLQIKEAIPIIKYWMEKETLIPSKKEYERALEELESGVQMFPELATAYCDKRDDWETHYASRKDYFYDDEDKDEYHKQKPIRVIKIGRNEPCPCGSGKKYKKCCLNKDNVYSFQSRKAIH